jgi:hypothetical protein
MVKEITRYVKPNVERELWARAAGRCQFDGCNRILYKSPVTQESVNISEKAHVYSFSKNGPRGWGPFALNKNALNDITNLMLMCHDCHKKIDQDKVGVKYSDQLLLHWKNKHEQRIYIVTGISPKKNSHVVMYGANIGEEKSPLQYVVAVEAMFPDSYPAEEKAINLSMSWEHKDRSPQYWTTERNNLQAIYEKNIVPRIIENSPGHFSLFAFAPQPLLIQLGILFTDKIDVNVYQLHREPKGWKWESHPDNFKYKINKPFNNKYQPALIVSLSDKISRDRVTSVIGDNVSIWELTIEKPHNDFLQSQAQLLTFRERVRELMVLIKNEHGQATPLSVFPAMPVACAIEFGRVRMPKADMPWIIYDQNNKEKKFIKALEILGG